MTGDGKHTLETLILDNPETRHEAKFYLEKHTAVLETIPESGAKIPLAPTAERPTGGYIEHLRSLCGQWRERFEA